MAENLAGDAFLSLHVKITGNFRAVLDERFLSVCGFTVDQPHQADEPFPGFSVRAAVPAGVNHGEFPFVSTGERLDGLSQGGGQSFYFSRRALRPAGLPQIRAAIAFLGTNTLGLAHAGFKVFRSRKIMKLREMA